MSRSELVPRPAQLVRVVNESADVKSFELEFLDGAKLEALPGQFVEVSVQGYGEATFAVSRLAPDHKRFWVSVKRMGHLTKMLHRLAAGETVGARGPYGKPFPVADWKGRSIYIIGGGIGLAPLRPVVDYVLQHRSDYAGIEILFGARTPQDMLFKDDLATWQADSAVRLHTTIDYPAEGWNGRVGFVPVVTKDLGLRPDNRIAVVCGPPIMIKLTAAALRELGWPEGSIYTTLEMKMQCGIGQCGRCNIGPKLVCKDGPVFRLDEIPGWAL